MIVGIMKRKIGFLVGILVILGLILGGVKLVGGGRSPKQGILRVVSTPVASVFLDNKHIGRTPVDTKVDGGSFTIRLVPETTTQTLASWEGNIKISPDILTYVNASLAESEFATAIDILSLEKITSKLAEVSVATNPDGATVALDGGMKGISPLSIPNITAGDHALAITSFGFVTRNLKVKTTAGYKLNAVVKLALSGDTPPEASASPTPPVSSTTPGKTTPTPAKAPGVATDPAKPFVTIKDTPTGFLRVRMEPTTAATESAQVKPGEKYSIVDTEKDTKGNTWYQITYDGKNTGWISGQYAEKTE